jgi:plasmid maintenance system antidote protein VapI
MVGDIKCLVKSIKTAGGNTVATILVFLNLLVRDTENICHILLRHAFFLSEHTNIAPDYYIYLSKIIRHSLCNSYFRNHIPFITKIAILKFLFFLHTFQMDNQWLEAQFHLNPGKSKAALARVLNLEPSAISKMLNGTRQIKASEYIGMRKFFGMATESGSNVSNTERTYSVRPLSSAMQEGYQHQEQDAWVMPASFFEKHTQTPPDNIKFFEATDKAMMPELDAGHYVLVDLSDTKPSPAGLFVLNDGVGTIIRHCEFIPQSSPLKLRVAAHNSSFRSYQVGYDSTEIIGRVVAKLEWI